MRVRRLSRQRTSTACTVEGARPTRVGDLHRTQAVLPAQVHDLRTTGAGVRLGEWCGRAGLAEPPVAINPSLAVGHETS
jgi:hypothetical protein